MIFIKTHFKLLALSVICLIGLTIFLWYPRIEKIPIIYPNYTFYTGQSLSEIKEMLKDKCYESDNDAGRRNFRYIVFDDTTANPRLRINSFLTFYKNHLVSFSCLFRASDSTYNLKGWLTEHYSQIVNDKNFRNYKKGDRIHYKLQKDNSFTHLVIAEKYLDYAASTFLVGDYRYKDIDWDGD